MSRTHSIKAVLKRGALLAAANWPVVAVQLVAETTFKVLLAVPLVGAAILLTVLLGADIGELMQGSLRDIFTTIASALMSEPVALVAFMCAFSVVLLGGAVLLFLVKGGTVTVLAAGNEVAGEIERPPLRLAAVERAGQFSLDRFTSGCARLFRPYLKLGLLLMVVYGLSVGLYLLALVSTYRAAGDRVALVSFTLTAALAGAGLVIWLTIVNLLYLLTQMAIAVDGHGVRASFGSIARFIRADLRELSSVFGVVVGLVLLAAAASALAWSGVGLIAFVPVVGLAVLPLQLAALLVRGVVFEYLGLTALGAYLSLYRRYQARAGDVRQAAPVRSSSTLSPST